MVDVAGAVEEHLARNAGSPSGACNGLALQASPQRLARQARFDFSSLSGRSLRARMFLAQAPELREIFYAKVANRFLDFEVRT